MINDLFGYIKRNYKKYNAYQLKKLLEEIKQIQKFIEIKLKEMERVA
jgi:hypothetical protein